MLTVGRAVLRAINDDATMQELQVGLLKGELRNGIERFQNYGFTSVPLVGAEGVIVFVGGNRDHGLCVAMDDRRHRKAGLEPGEAAMYTDEGDYILMKRGRIVEVVAGSKVDITAPEVAVHASTKVVLDTPLVEASGNVSVDGDLTVTGSTTLGATVTSDGKNIGSTHTHGGVQPGSGTSGAPT